VTDPLELPLTGLNGVRRNWRKLGNEYRRLRHEMRPHWRRYRARPWDVHALVNLPVEACEISPYWVGHAIVFALAGAFGVTVLAAWWWWPW
jgi:hypothetical protein